MSSIEQLIDALDSSSERDLESLRSELAKLTVDDALIAQLTPDPVPSTGYHRNLLRHGEDYELVVATWPVGGGTLIHDHGSDDSHGMVRVLKGDIFNHVYRREGEGVTPTAQLTHSEGDYIAVTKGLIHAMGNDGGQDFAMSLHLYSPMIVNVSFWDPVTLESVQQPV